MNATSCEWEAHARAAQITYPMQVRKQTAVIICRAFVLLFKRVSDVQ